MIQATILNEEITSNNGNEIVIVDLLRAFLQRIDTDLLETRYVVFKERTETQEYKVPSQEN